MEYKIISHEWESRRFLDECKNCRVRRIWNGTEYVYSYKRRTTKKEPKCLLREK